MGAAVNIKGQKYGRLTVLENIGSKNNRLLWKCLCDCGNYIERSSDRLRTGNTTSCGCIHREQLSRRSTTHGMSTRNEYRIWKDMRDRCRNPKNTEYKNYGGRGITVCDEWLHSFERFFSDMGPRPSKKHTIDRIDNEKGYQAGNCKWATWTEQARNRRNTRTIKFNGSLVSAAELAEILNVDYKRLRGYLDRGKSIEEALKK